MMFEEIKNIKTGKKYLRSFGITFGIIFLIITFYLFCLENESYQIIFYLSVSFIAFGLILPNFLKPIYIIWMTFAIFIGWIMTRVILSLLFFIIVTPVGLALRILGKDLLDLNKQDIQKSYWNMRDSDLEQNQNYEKQY